MNNNEYWMTALPDEVRNLSLINIAIPGTHNSMTYGITNEIAPDADGSTRKLNHIFPCFVRRWAKTQSSNIQEQLILGVRYFDLRVCQKYDKFYYTHGLLCAMDIFEPLDQIIQFLSSHPGEIVVIDFQHFYNMTATHHKELHTLLLNYLGKHLFTTTDGSLFNCTLNHCTNLRKQILLIYRRCPIILPSEFWPSKAWPTPWPNAASSKKLKKFLQDALLSRNITLGYVSQCVLTPSGRYITLSAHGY